MQNSFISDFNPGESLHLSLSEISSHTNCRSSWQIPEIVFYTNTRRRSLTDRENRESTGRGQKEREREREREREKERKKAREGYSEDASV